MITVTLSREMWLDAIGEVCHDRALVMMAPLGEQRHKARLASGSSMSVFARLAGVEGPALTRKVHEVLTEHGTELPPSWRSWPVVHVVDAWLRETRGDGIQDTEASAAPVG